MNTIEEIYVEMIKETRSKLEQRIMYVLMFMLDQTFLYEPLQFIFGELGIYKGYLPDLFFPKGTLFAEIKGAYYLKEGEQKIKLLSSLVMSGKKMKDFFGEVSDVRVKQYMDIISRRMDYMVLRDEHKLISHYFNNGVKEPSYLYLAKCKNCNHHYFHGHYVECPYCHSEQNRKYSMLIKFTRDFFEYVSFLTSKNYRHYLSLAKEE